jgi:hypothetical protein
VGMALALLVRTRLGLASEVHAHRAMALSRRLHKRVRACALHRPLWRYTNGRRDHHGGQRATERHVP